MNGYIPWTIPVDVDEAVVPSVVSTLIQSGIKLFLHQRNQIPVPVEQLGKRLVHYDEREPTGHDGNVEDEVADDEDNEADIRRRIQDVISRRKKRHNNLRKMRISKMILQREEKALKSIMDTLAVLNEQTLRKLPHILTVGLFFGPSLRSSKEIIFFDTSMCAMEGYECVNGFTTTIPNDSLVSLLTRSFHKAVIMSEDFCEMTTQSLRSTRTHVCVLARAELSNTEAEAENSMSLLDDADIFNDYFLLKETNESETDESSLFVASADSSSSTLNSSSTSTSSTPPLRVTDRRKGKKKALLIKLILQERKDKCDRGIDSIREKFLFCYQIPLRLKGIVSCKNTQM